MEFSNFNRSVNNSMRPVFVGMAAALIMGGGVMADAQAQTLYRITQIAPAFSDAYDINDLGQVVGRVGSVGDYEGFVWSQQSGLQRIGFLPGADSRGESVALGINNASKVTGWSNSASGQHAFVWSNATGMQDIGTLPVISLENSTGAAINSAGQIALNDVSGNKKGFVWSNPSVMVNLGGLAPPGTSAHTNAYDINDAGQVVGQSSSRGFVWTADNGMIDIGSLPGGSGSTSANGINNLGQVVGASRNGDRAFIWSSAEGIQPLAMPGSDFDRYSIAYEINDAGVVVGDMVSGSGGFVWTAADGMFDLNTLIDPTDPLHSLFRIDHAYAINAGGQIVGKGYLNRFAGNPGGNVAFMLTPVPEAETYALMLAGLGLVGFAARRRSM
jgi:probable HAF family extracellular repeat protein